MPPTKDVPRTPRAIKLLEHGHCKKTTNLDMFDHLVPSRLGIHDEFIPNSELDLRFVPLFTVEHFVIALNGTKRDAPKEVPDFNLFLPKFFGIPSSNMACF